MRVAAPIVSMTLLLFTTCVDAQTREDTFRRADRNGDGVIDREENAAFVDVDFNERDADRDGKISHAELQVWLRTHVYGQQPGTPVALPTAAVSAVAATDIQQKDLDGDGFISRDEHRKAAKQFFRALDRNGDGRLTHNEFGRPPGGQRQ
ncbi:EF-hand domain-containing protein [Pseudoxanthomonas sp. JBR18]|uniref:EF-hand domain-containing protein n=1 Tax=Pseudoxanthomonas sp. JBR18 TaxID=2969308 RepID=UPI002305CA5D|nr:EF-hand domain-containing protein [Pseudoxanthomonas sp. JBR18]WCE02633.1 EF-hand domain-containing protein [Pseudoxanthomonas sp. JBR18]